MKLKIDQNQRMKRAWKNRKRMNNQRKENKMSLKNSQRNKIGIKMKKKILRNGMMITLSEPPKEIDNSNIYFIFEI